ncbi:MAG: sugar phosphate isomerase/epimerase family protein [Balneolales bacterium]
MKLYLHLAQLLILSITISVTSCSPSNTNIQSIQLDNLEDYKIGEFLTGVQAYTFNRFTVMEAIEKNAAAGGRIIEFYPGQKYSPDDDTAFRDMSDDHIEQLFAKLEEHDIKMISYGVIGLTDPDQARSVFEFAQKLGLPAITSNPDTNEELDFIEPLVKEFDIMMGIHNHAIPDDGSFQGWNPEHIASLVADRDPRIGACADTGHWIRSGINPVDGLKTLEGRIISLHLKDVDRFDRQGDDVPFGSGIGDVSGVLQELKRQNFGGYISVEYESNWMANVPEVAYNIGFIRGWSEQ